MCTQRSPSFMSCVAVVVVVISGLTEPSSALVRLWGDLLYYACKNQWRTEDGGRGGRDCGLDGGLARPQSLWMVSRVEEVNE